MRSLKKQLMKNPAFPVRQRDKFDMEVSILLMESKMGKKGAIFCLRQLWQSYDEGGHSMGRSFRSFILEKVLRWLRSGSPLQLQKAKTALSILVAMHYDYGYINRHHWFDYRLKGMQDLPIYDRIKVSAAAIALGVDDIPSLDDWSTEQIRAFINDDEQMITLLNEYKSG